MIIVREILKTVTYSNSPRLYARAVDSERIARLCHTGSDDCHFVDLIGVAAAGEVIDRRIQTL